MTQCELFGVRTCCPWQLRYLPIWEQQFHSTWEGHGWQTCRIICVSLDTPCHFFDLFTYFLGITSLLCLSIPCHPCHLRIEIFIWKTVHATKVVQLFFSPRLGISVSYIFIPQAFHVFRMELVMFLFTLRRPMWAHTKTIVITQYGSFELAPFT